jgi:hypothetical protein
MCWTILNKVCKSDDFVPRFGLSLVAKDYIQKINIECRPKSTDHILASFPSISVVKPISFWKNCDIHVDILIQSMF